MAYTGNRFIGATALVAGIAVSAGGVPGLPEPFTYGEYTLFRSRDRCDIRACSILDSHYDLRRDMDRLSAAAYWMRLLRASCTHGQECAGVFDMALRALAYLCYADLPTFAFESKLASLSGVAPRVDECCVCRGPIEGAALFDPAAGGAVCASCSGRGTPISAMARRMLHKLPRSPFENVHLLLDKPEWTEAASHMRAFIRQEIPLPDSVYPGLPAA